MKKNNKINYNSKKNKIYKTRKASKKIYNNKKKIQNILVLIKKFMKKIDNLIKNGNNLKMLMEIYYLQ